ncbi:MAG: hypothetical protein MZU95_08650 [Desulfomicrobium escambiense]|nr:hypothetical protein [Desulfomicrobium escambiense]
MTSSSRLADDPLMLMAIDVGNTNIVGGVYEETTRSCETLPRSRPSPRRPRTSTSPSCRAILAERGIDPGRDRPRRHRAPWCRALTRRHRAAMCRRLFRDRTGGPGPGALSPPARQRCSAPDEIGTDLVADAVAAYDKVRGRLHRGRLRHRPRPSPACPAAARSRGLHRPRPRARPWAPCPGTRPSCPTCSSRPPPSVTGARIPSRPSRPGWCYGYTGLVEYLVGQDEARSWAARRKVDRNRRPLPGRGAPDEGVRRRGTRPRPWTALPGSPRYVYVRPSSRGLHGLLGLGAPAPQEFGQLVPGYNVPVRRPVVHGLARQIPYLRGQRLCRPG